MKIKHNKYMQPELILRPFQQQCVLEMVKLKRGLIALPTGTGKTITAFSIFTYIKHQFPKTKLLFITEKPLILQTVYQDLPTYFQDLKTNYVYNNSNEERKQIIAQWKTYLDILIINYATLRINFNEIGKAIQHIEGNFITILDEATAFKNRDAQITKMVYKLCQASKRAYGMTATPGTSGLYDIFNILTVLGVSPYKTKSEFERHHCELSFTKMFLFKFGNKKTMGIGKPSSNPNQVDLFFSIRKSFKIKEAVKILSRPNIGIFKILNEANGSFMWTVNKSLITKTNIIASSASKNIFISVFIFNGNELKNYRNIKGFREATRNTMFIRAKKEIVSELPKLTVSYRYCEETKEVSQAITKLYESGKYSASQVEIALVTPQVYNKDLPRDYKSDKVKELISFIKELNNEKVIVFFPFTQTTEILKEILQKELNTKVAYVTGETKDQNSELKRFLEDDTYQILIGTSTILKGLNLQSINYIVVLHPTNTAGNYLQLIGRINRIGAKPVPKLVTWIVTEGTRDEDLKESIIEQAVTICKFDSKLVDDGVIPKKYLRSKQGMTESQAKKFLDNQLEARKVNYIK